VGLSGGWPVSGGAQIKLPFDRARRPHFRLETVSRGLDVEFLATFSIQIFRPDFLAQLLAEFSGPDLHHSAARTGVQCRARPEAGRFRSKRSATLYWLRLGADFQF